MKHIALAALAPTLVIASALAQCEPQLTGAGNPFGVVSGSSTRLQFWDPDGAGPQPQVVLMAGIINPLSAAERSFLTWNPQTNEFGDTPPVPAGLWNGITVAPDNSLVAFGDFTGVGPGGANAPVLRLVNGTWTPVGNNLTGNARVLSINPSGQIVVASSGVLSVGTTTSSMAVWNGSAWSPIGTARTSVSGGSNGIVSRVTYMPNGNIVAGGVFQSINGVAASNIAQWNGTIWSALGAGSQEEVQRIAADPANGDLYATGWFNIRLGVFNQLARWDGTAWQSTNDPDWQQVSSGRMLTFAEDGDLVTGHWDAQQFMRINRRDGNTWSFLPGAFTGAYIWDTLFLPNGDVLAAGDFRFIDGQRIGNLALYRNGTWQPMFPGFDRPINGLLALVGSEVLAWGDFVVTDDGAARNIAKFDGQSWSDFSAGWPAGSAVPNSIVRMTDGRIVAVNARSVPAAPPVHTLYTWNGSAWEQWSPVFNDQINDIVATPSGQLVAVGTFTAIGSTPVNRIAIWTDGAWQPLGAGFNFAPYVVDVLPSGEIQTLGGFTQSGSTPVSRAARWTGSAWTQLGSGLPTSLAMVTGVMPRSGAWHATLNELIGSGGQTVLRQWRLNGSVWQPATGFSMAVPTLLPDDTLIYGSSAGSPLVWNGSSVQPWATDYPFPTAFVQAAVRHDNGRTSYAGSFTDASGRRISTFVQVIPCTGCDSIDFNGNGVFPEDQDVNNFFEVLAGAPCPTGTCNDIDFNNNGVFPEDQDVVDFFNVLAGGDCP